jgi:hypothetical protein
MKRLFLISFIALIGLLSAFYCKAEGEYIYIDNFESYSNQQSLDGQMNPLGTFKWEGGISAQNTIVNSGNMGAVMERNLYSGARAYTVEGGNYFLNSGIFEVYISLPNWTGQTIYLTGLGNATIFDAKFENYRFYYFDSGWVDYGVDVSTSTVQHLTVSFYQQPTCKYNVNLNDDNPATNIPEENCNDLGRILFLPVDFPLDSGLYVDDVGGVGAVPPPSTINITSPVSGTATSSTFDLSGTYNLNGENWPAFFIALTSWSTSCPAEVGDDTWNSNLDYGYVGGAGRFDDLTAGENPFSIHFENVAQGHYNCIYCYFFNSTSTSQNKCPDYRLDLIYLSPAPEIPTQSFDFYCNQHSSSCPATGTIVAIAYIFSPLFKLTTGWFMYFQNIFDLNQVDSLGSTMGATIPQIRSMLNSFNDILGGGFPLSQLLIFLIFFEIAIIIYKLVSKIVGLIRGGG